MLSWNIFQGPWIKVEPFKRGRERESSPNAPIVMGLINVPDVSMITCPLNSSPTISIKFFLFLITLILFLTLIFMQLHTPVKKNWITRKEGKRVKFNNRIARRGLWACGVVITTAGEIIGCALGRGEKKKKKEKKEKEGNVFNGLQKRRRGTRCLVNHWNRTSITHYFASFLLIFNFLIKL